MLIINQTISTTTIITPRNGCARHQLDFSGTTGTVSVELDAGTGFRAIHTVELSEMDRLPLCLELEAIAFRITPSVQTTMCYMAEEA